jgi:hypothetical protein
MNGREQPQRRVGVERKVGPIIDDAPLARRGRRAFLKRRLVLERQPVLRGTPPSPPS